MPIVKMRGPRLECSLIDSSSLWDPDVLVVLVENNRTVNDVTPFNTYPLTKYGLGLRILFPHERGWTLYASPLNGSKGSAAIYIAEREGHAVQIIPPYSRTSAHLHPDTIETFQPLYGKSWLATGDGTVKVEELDWRCATHTEPLVNHMLITRESPAVNLLQTDPPQWLREIHHVHMSDEETERLYSESLRIISSRF